MTIPIWASILITYYTIGTNFNVAENAVRVENYCARHRGIFKMFEETENGFNVGHCYNMAKKEEIFNVENIYAFHYERIDQNDDAR